MGINSTCGRNCSCDSIWDFSYYKTRDVKTETIEYYLCATHDPEWTTPSWSK